MAEDIEYIIIDDDSSDDGIQIIEDPYGTREVKEELLNGDRDKELADKFNFAMHITSTCNKKFLPKEVKKDEDIDTVDHLVTNESQAHGNPAVPNLERDDAIELDFSDDDDLTAAAQSFQSTIRASSNVLEVPHIPKTPKEKKVAPSNMMVSVSKVSIKQVHKTIEKKKSGQHASEKHDFKKDASEKRKREKRLAADKVAVKFSTLTCTDRNEEDFKSVYEFIKAVIGTGFFELSYAEKLLKMGDMDFLTEMEKLILDCDLKSIPESLYNKMIKIISEKTGEEPRVFTTTPKPSSIFRPFSFVKWTDDKEDLTIRFEKVVADADVKSPLGVIFDGDHFIFSGGKRIFSCTENGNDLKVLIDDLRGPSALTVIHPTGLVFLPSSGVLITMQKKGGSSDVFLIAYDIRKANHIFGFYNYGSGLPSFMTAHDDLVFVTDLELKTIRSFKVLSHKECVTMSLMHSVALSSLSDGLGCHYPAGLACDSRKEIILVDARHEGGLVIWGDAHLTSWKKIQISSATFPYTSQIAISPKGYLLAACRKSHCMKLFRFQ